jgi:SAM-dependent methyltransferase
VRAESLILDILRCPSCGGQVALDTQAVIESDGHVIEGELSCNQCRERYPIRHGVPRMMPAALARDVSDTVDAFGWQWQQAQRMLTDPRFSAPEVFVDFIYPVQHTWFKDKVVLDAGCGLGRFTIASARFGARLVVGVDLSASVDLVFEQTRHLRNVVVVQADILQLPLARAIDYAFSVAVLHHTADPRAAFLHLTSKVVPGGSVSAWVYGRENNGWIVYGINPIRQLTSRLPRRLLLAASYALAVPMTMAIRGIYGPVSRHRALRPLRRWLFYYEYLAFLDQFDFATIALVIFDHAVPAIAQYIPRAEFVEWFEAAGLVESTITMRQQNSWRGFGLVPNAAPPQSQPHHPD